MTTLEKRLIAAMDFGIIIQHLEDGHRRICLIDNSNYYYPENLIDKFKNLKIYGSLTDALNLIDFAFKKYEFNTTLEQHYDNNQHNDDIWYTKFSDKNILTIYENETDFERYLGIP